MTQKNQTQNGHGTFGNGQFAIGAELVDGVPKLGF